MVAATAVVSGGDAPAAAIHRAEPRRILRPHQALACAGAALAGFWPGTVLSSTHLIVVSACFVPIGMRTLLRLEESLVAPGPQARPEPPLGELAPVLRHTRTGLALLDLPPTSQTGATGDTDEPPAPRVHLANPAYRDLAAATVGGSAETSFDPRRIFVSSAAARVEAALADLAAGRATTWTGVLGLTSRADGTRWVQVELVRLPDDEAREHSRIALSMVRREAAARSTQGCAPHGWSRGRRAPGSVPPVEAARLESA